MARRGMGGLGHTGSLSDAPLDVRGQVFAMEAGRNASYDLDLGPGWKHIGAVKEGGLLKLYIDGELQATSCSFDVGEYIAWGRRDIGDSLTNSAGENVRPHGERM